MLQGQDFLPTEDRKSPSVAIVNQAFADRYFEHGNPVGKKLWMNGRDKNATEIVGMVANGRTDDLTKGAEPEIYFPFWQWGAFSKHLVIRTTADPRTIVAAVQRENCAQWIRRSPLRTGDAWSRFATNPWRRASSR